MKQNLKLTPGLTVKSLVSKAHKARALAAVKTNAHKTFVAKPKKIEPEIEREIRWIFRTLSSNALEDNVVALERSDKGASCHAIISIYRQNDLDRQKEEIAQRKLAAQNGEQKSRCKVFKAHPIVMFAFYHHIMDCDKLGSIAIYGEDAATYHSIVLRRGSLFGHRVISASLEMGKRLFVDVKLAS